MPIKNKHSLERALSLCGEAKSIIARRVDGNFDDYHLHQVWTSLCETARLDMALCDLRSQQNAKEDQAYERHKIKCREQSQRVQDERKAKLAADERLPIAAAEAADGPDVAAAAAAPAPEPAATIVASVNSPEASASAAAASGAAASSCEAAASSPGASASAAAPAADDRMDFDIPDDDDTATLLDWDESDDVEMQTQLAIINALENAFS